MGRGEGVRTGCVLTTGLDRSGQARTPTPVPVITSLHGWPWGDAPFSLASLKGCPVTAGGG